MGVSGTTATNGQVGNLQLTASQEADLVNFLKILTDGYDPAHPRQLPVRSRTIRSVWGRDTGSSPSPGLSTEPDEG